MLKQRTQYDEDFKKNAVKLSYASPKILKELSEDLGIHAQESKTAAREKPFKLLKLCGL